MTLVYKRREMDRSNDCIDYNDPHLLPRHKIFLSHSGAQKEDFVEQLCVDLEKRHRFPFFDKRPSSLPKAERFPPHIEVAIAQCELMVVVISDEYFTSKWPMIEFHAFMQASVKNQKLKILPLFWGLNVEEFCDTGRQEGWFKVWEKMAEDDGKGRIKVDEWKQSLKLIVLFNGLVYDRASKEVVAYRKDIVTNICKAIPPDIKLDELHVQGRSKLCQVVRQHLETIPNSTKIPGVRVMGLYGVGGIGKTQICKIMCNELEGEFDGKVCHVELGNQSGHELVKRVLTTLTNTSVEVVQEVGEDKCRDVLLNNTIWKQKVFLTIDNVWDDSHSLEQANMFLRAPFIEGSCVIVTSRFKKTLKSLGIDESACFEMPELDKNDAKNLFLYHAAKGKNFENTEDVDAIEECIQSCYFGKGESQGSHYHPLSLKALGVFLQYGGKGPFVWAKDLQKLKESSYLRHPKNDLFTILRSNFDRLPMREQELFMDVSLYFPTYCFFSVQEDLMEWLCLVHNKEKEVIEDWLEHLKDCALLEDVDTSFGKISMHGLYREFAKLESEGKLVDMDMEKQRWVYAKDAFPEELEDKPRSCWKRLTRVCILESGMKILIPQHKGPIMSLRRIEWKYCTKLVVLKLENLSELTGVLNLKDLICLRSLSVHLRSIIDSIEGLEGLKTLTFFRMLCTKPVDFDYDRDKQPNVGQLPAALKVLNLNGYHTNLVFIARDVLALCTNLVTLKLFNVSASNLDLKNCTSLQKLELRNVKDLEILEGFGSEQGSSLQSFLIHCCRELVEVRGLDRLVGLQTLGLHYNKKLSKLPTLTGLKCLHTLSCFDLRCLDEVPGLDGLVGLKYLTLLDCPQLSKLPSLTGLQCLQRLEISRLGILSEIPHLSGLEQLKTVIAFRNDELTSLQCFRDLPALKTIDLRGCRSLCRLSDMSKLTNLKTLDLRDSGVELDEEDMRMLEGFPQLEPVLVASLDSDILNRNGHRTAVPRYKDYRLDFHRYKILCFLSAKRKYFWDASIGRQSWVKRGWEEKDLHVPRRGFKIQDVPEIWKLVPGPATQIRGTDGKYQDRAAFLIGENPRTNPANRGAPQRDCS